MHVAKRISLIGKISAAIILFLGTFFLLSRDPLTILLLISIIVSVIGDVLILSFSVITMRKIGILCLIAFQLLLFGGFLYLLIADW
jgi:hypothetical protein